MLSTIDIEEAAHKAAGNWQRFESFVWFRDRETSDSQNWAVIYTHNRDTLPPFQTSRMLGGD